MGRRVKRTFLFRMFFSRSQTLFISTLIPLLPIQRENFRRKSKGRIWEDMSSVITWRDLDQIRMEGMLIEKEQFCIFVELPFPTSVRLGRDSQTSFALFTISFDWLVMAAWGADRHRAECPLGWWCLPQASGGPPAMHFLPLTQWMQRNSEKLMLILSVTLATKKKTQTNKPQVSWTAEYKLILVKDRMFCWCCVGKVFPAAHSSLPLIWMLSLFREDTLLYNSNLDMSNLPGMFHVPSLSEPDHLWWESAALGLTAHSSEEGGQERLSLL